MEFNQRSFFVAVVLIYLGCLFPVKVFATPSETEMTQWLRESDIARGGLDEGVFWKIKIETVDLEENESSSREFEVRSQDGNAIAEATKPVRNKGEIFLFVGRDMWFHKPDLSKPVTISSRQRLSGQAANGDIASTHYSRDYSPVFEKFEKLTLPGEAPEDTAVLLLKAKNTSLTYDKIRYWISLKHKLGMRAEFLSLEGKAIKTAIFEYKNEIRFGANKFAFISKMKITSLPNTNDQSVLTYIEPVSTRLSKNLFLPSQLGK